jgi:hydrogenase maturation protein HypF
MAAKFHRGLARGIADVCRQFDLPVVLTGGVFQNRLLTEATLDELVGVGADVGRHSTIPPNDGGLAAGQLAIGVAQLLCKDKER